MATEPFSSADKRGLYRAIFERRDIRNYRPDAVPESTLWRVLNAAHHAPSVGFMQPWDFIVVRDKAVRKEMYEHFRAINEDAAAAHQGDRKATYRALKLQGLLDAPLNIIVTCDRSRGGPNVLGRHTLRHMDEYSTCLAVQNLWLAARAEGLGVGWMSLLDLDFVSSLFGLPNNVLPVAYLTLGYPVEFPEQPMLQNTGWRSRESLEPRVFLDAYAQAYPNPNPQEMAPYQVSRPEPSVPTASDIHCQPTAAARHRQAELTKPPGSLGRLEELGLKLAGLQQREIPIYREPRLLLFAADHGVVSEQVSAYLPQATAQMVYQYLSGGAAINALCRQHQVELCVVDVGVDHDFGEARGLVKKKVARGTRCFTTGPAMSTAQVQEALDVGASIMAQSAGSTVIALGEMGIANTTAAAALLAAITKQSAADVVGLGTGASEFTLVRKIEVVERALRLHPSDDPLEALRCLGGFEIAALVGAIEAAPKLSQLVVLDGFITGVAALVAVRRKPEVKNYLVAGHCSAERAHAQVLALLGLKPLLSLELRLGEGSGALLAMALVQSSALLMQEMRTFEEANIERPLNPKN